MFTTRRFPVSEAPKDGFEFVTIPNFKPCRVKHNQYSAEVYVNCEPVITEKGSRTHTLNYRASSRALLRDTIEQKHPDASFSATGSTMDDVANAKAALAKLREDAQMSRPVTKDEKRQAYTRLVKAYGQGAEITAEKCAAQGISARVFNALYHQEAQNFAAMVTSEHRKLAAEMSEQERRNLTAANVGSFVNESAWAEWFKQLNGNFFGFPDYSNKNYQTLMAYCDARGWSIPLSGELDVAMRYLLAHGHFYMQHTYPRTQRDAYRQVRPFVNIEPDVVPVDERRQALEATKHLNAKQLKQNLQNLRADSTKNLSPAEARQRNRIIY